VTGAGWWCVETASGLLEPREREAVLGDLAEAGDPMLRGLLDVLGLALRRQALLWKSWRPWVSAFGVALPNSFLLMGFSLVVSGMAWQTFGGELGASELRLALCQMTLLGIVAWSCGFVVGAVSRKTVWASAAACMLPCLFCCSRFAVPRQSPLSLLLFIPFALWGVLLGRWRMQLRMSVALVLAGMATMLAVPGVRINGDLRHWTCLLSLLWPAWYVAAISGRRPAKAHSS
jgi:hypothetical protein